ncbi:MAG: hypothetical protein LBK26_04440 [Rickettsiales bacterium]|jgi:peptidoglycan hydrolase CwlO-like protein|nr:hypothetical protein [Rickettsiales bacterium]
MKNKKLMIRLIATIMAMSGASAQAAVKRDCFTPFLGESFKTMDAGQLRAALKDLRNNDTATYAKYVDCSNCSDKNWDGATQACLSKEELKSKYPDPKKLAKELEKDAKNTAKEFKAAFKKWDKKKEDFAQTEAEMTRLKIQMETLCESNPAILECKSLDQITGYCVAN